MNILTSQQETFDSFLSKTHEAFKEDLEKALERYDREIYCSIDHKRFVLVRLDERTVLSSHGAIRLKRRYYYDTLLGEYCHLLDSRLQIPKSKRMTGELIVKMMELASIMSYKETGEHLSDEFVISKYTVWKTINETVLETQFTSGAADDRGKIHVQVDEKFIGMTNSPNKKRYYTMTVFAGKKRAGRSNSLLNKTVISSSSLKELKARLNEMLQNRYHVSMDEEVFVSGDFATYIQHFGDSIMCCKSRYVPDKFHVYKTLRDALPDVHADDRSLNDRRFRRYIAGRLKGLEDANARKLRGILARSPSCFEPYLDGEYLGCSQEGQNSHIYAPRFGKYANRFSPSTIEKLAMIREAKAMNAKVVITHTARVLPEPIGGSLPRKYQDPAKYVLDTSGMSHETAKMFNEIKYGGM